MTEPQRPLTESDAAMTAAPTSLTDAALTEADAALTAPLDFIRYLLKRLSCNESSSPHPPDAPPWALLAPPICMVKGRLSGK